MRGVVGCGAGGKSGPFGVAKAGSIAMRLAMPVSPAGWRILPCQWGKAYKAPRSLLTSRTSGGLLAVLSSLLSLNVWGSGHETVLINERGLVMMRTMGCYLLVLLWTGVLNPLAAAELRHQSSPLTVVAIASDVQAIVFRDAEGHLVSYTVGDLIAGSDWKVAVVSSDTVVLEAQKRFNGAKLSTRLGMGHVFDAMDAGPMQAASPSVTFPNTAYANPIKPNK